jgi:tetratricopeptide (TPR) repeat protein
MRVKKVLDFRRSLERDKKIMFDTFDAANAFKDKVRCYLAQWVRDHEGGRAIKVTFPSEDLKTSSKFITPPDEIIVATDSPKVEKLVSEAWELADQGRLTDAETKFAQAIVSGDAEAMNNYGLFLDQVGRQQQAEIAFARAKELSIMGKDQEEEAVANENLGSLFLKKGDFSKAEQMHRKALEIHGWLGNQKGVAAAYGNLGSVFGMRGDLFQAEQMHNRELELYTKIGFQEGMAASYSNLGVILSSQDDLTQNRAEKNYRKALEIYKKLNNQEGVANQYCNLGLLLSTQKNNSAARELWNFAIELYSKNGMLQMVNKVQGWLDDLQ